MYGAAAWSIDRVYRLLRHVIFRCTDPERAHEMACRAIGYLGQGEWLAEELASLVWRLGYAGDRKLGQTVGGVCFPNPFGLPAGFDKYGLIVYLLHLFGFGFVEAGTFTLPPRDGNPRPRLERIPADRGLINRKGWDNPGAETGAANLHGKTRSVPVFVSVGPRPDVKSPDEAVGSVITALEFLAPRAEVISLNPSCSNVKIVDFQDPVLLAELLDAITTSGVTGDKPIAVKLDPQTSGKELSAIGEVCLSRGAWLILGNTRRTVRGALSGPRLYGRMLKRIGYIHQRFGGELTTIACGGIETAAQAYEAIGHGATLVQGLTGWPYGGPFWPREIVSGLSRRLKREGHSNISEVRGTYWGR